MTRPITATSGRPIKRCSGFLRARLEAREAWDRNHPAPVFISPIFTPIILIILNPPPLDSTLLITPLVLIYIHLLGYFFRNHTTGLLFSILFVYLLSVCVRSSFWSTGTQR